MVIDRVAGAIRLVASVRLSVGTLLFEPFDLDFLYEGRPWPWLAWDWKSRSYVKGQGQAMKIVYALPFEPVVRSRSIFGLGNCEWPLPVDWNCLFVSNQGAFNVSRVSGRSAVISWTTESLNSMIFPLGRRKWWGATASKRTHSKHLSYTAGTEYAWTSMMFVWYTTCHTLWVYCYS